MPATDVAVVPLSLDESRVEVAVAAEPAVEVESALLPPDAADSEPSSALLAKVPVDAVACDTSAETVASTGLGVAGALRYPAIDSEITYSVRRHPLSPALGGVDAAPPATEVVAGTPLSSGVS